MATYTFIMFYNGQESYDNHIITYNKNTDTWTKETWLGSHGLGTGVFGNFHPHIKGYNGTKHHLDLSYVLHGKNYVFPTSEHAYQASKCVDNNDVQTFCDIKMHASKSFGMGRKIKLRPDWETSKLSVMEDVVFHKFTQNSLINLKQTLLETNDAYLIEHTPVKGRDKFWADDHNGTGLNNLGKILMNTREKLEDRNVIRIRT